MPYIVTGITIALAVVIFIFMINIFIAGVIIGAIVYLFIVIKNKLFGPSKINKTSTSTSRIYIKTFRYNSKANNKSRKSTESSSGRIIEHDDIDDNNI